MSFEILNYNPLAGAKYDLVDDLEFCFEEQNHPLYSNEEMNNFYDVAQKMGIKNLIKD